MKLRMSGAILCLVAAVALGGTADVMGDCDPIYEGGSIAVTSGTLAGQTLNPADPVVVIEDGALLEGTVNIHVVNNGNPGDVFPVCGTTSWGPHETSGWEITWHHAPGGGDYAVPISVTVPSEPGTYYLFFAAAWELYCSNILSCTNWTNMGDIWNDGYDVADWTDAQAQHAISRGWVCSMWYKEGYNEVPIPAAAVRILVTGDCDPGYTGGSIVVTGGTLGGQTLDPANPRALAAGGTLLEGTVNIHVVNNGAGSDIFPVCATTSWGPHETSGWGITGHQAPGGSDYGVPISVTVPMELGTYYLFFAAGWELFCSNVLSCTNWSNPGGDIWNDGYDVADWTDAQAQNAIVHGWTCSKWVKYETLIDVSIPAAAVSIVVVPPAAVESTSWGAIKEIFK